MIKNRIAAIAMGAALATSAIIAPQASATTTQCVGDTFVAQNPTVSAHGNKRASTTFEKWDNSRQDVLKVVKKEDGKTTYEVLKGAKKGDNSVKAEFKQTHRGNQKTTGNVTFKLGDCKKGGGDKGWDIDKSSFGLSSRN